MAERIDKVLERGNLSQTGQPVEKQNCSQKSRQTNHSKAMIRLWTRMAQIYGTLWERQFGSHDGDAFQVWSKGLADLTPGMIRHGLGKCLHRSSQFPPNLPEFRQLCAGAGEHGLPEAYEAYQEAARKCRNPRAGNWSHAAVFVAGRATGWFHLRELPERQSWPRFKGHYETACQRVIRGENLDDEIPQALPREVSKPVSREKAKEKISEIRKLMGAT